MATLARASFRLFKQHAPTGNIRARPVMTSVHPRGKNIGLSSAGTGQVVAAGAAAAAAMVTAVLLSTTDNSVVAEGKRESGRAAWSSRLSSQTRGDKKEEAEKLPDEGPYFNPNYDFLMVVGGSSNKPLAAEIAEELGIKCGKLSLGRYADGEVMVRLDENVRGKDVYIVQSGQKPVNDNLVELLLTVSTMQRASAKRVTAVIPYFPYKHHRRSVPVSQDLHSRFLWSAAADVGRLLEVMGVDRVIAVDLERPGTGSGGAFLGPGVPVETLLTTNLFAEHMANKVFGTNKSHPKGVTIISPSSGLVKKAIQFKRMLQVYVGDVKVQTFLHARPNSGPVDVNSNELMGDIGKVKGRDVVIVDELIDTGGTLGVLPRKLRDAGAEDIYVVSSHGLFNANAISILEESPVRTVFVTNSVPLPAGCKSSKIEQMHIGRYLARMIFVEHVRSSDFVDKHDIVIE